MKLLTCSPRSSLFWGCAVPHSIFLKFGLFPSEWARLAPALFSGFIPQINPPALESLLPAYAADDQKLQLDLSMNGFPRSVFRSLLSLRVYFRLIVMSLNFSGFFFFCPPIPSIAEKNLFFVILTCFWLSEVTSHGNGPTMTPESSLNVTRNICRAVTVPHLNPKICCCTWCKIDSEFHLIAPLRNGRKTLWKIKDLMTTGFISLH